MSKIIGIVGFGLVGKSYLHSVHVGDRVLIWDQRTLSDEELQLIQQASAVFVSASEKSLQSFVAECDIVLPSPGIDLSLLSINTEKIQCELDHFSQKNMVPVIAITGTLGKTSTVLLFEQILRSILGEKEVLVAGNVGVPMLDVLDYQENYKQIILELSSWQLEYSHRFAPEIAILSNLYPNHLDRHKTMEAYLKAKLKLIAFQNSKQWAVLPVQLLEGPHQKQVQCVLKKTGVQVLALGKSSHVNVCIYREDDWLIVRDHNEKHKLINISDLPSVTVFDNWLIIFAVLYIKLGRQKIECIKNHLRQLSSQFQVAHRVEFIGSINQADFYNDSKSTVPEATQAAVRRLELNKRPIILILGGCSKGVDRSAFIEELKRNNVITKIYSFGPGAQDLKGCLWFETLEEIFEQLLLVIKPGDQVLFSPSGSSFDLFKNYVHRGQVFKDLVRARIH